MGSERERFEEWFSGHPTYSDWELNRKPDGSYIYTDAIRAWKIWCAATEISPKSSPPPNTVRVRVPVAVDERGRWFASGCSRDSEDHSSGDARTSLVVITDEELEIRTAIVVADVPLPAAPVEVKGEVSDG